LTIKVLGSPVPALASNETITSPRFELSADKIVLFEKSVTSISIELYAATSFKYTASCIKNWPPETTEPFLNPWLPNLST
jgi:hypothetical protein